MENIDARLAKLNAKHAKDIEDANREHAIAMALPVPPKRVVGPDWRTPWAGYEVETLAEACEIMQSFTVAPAHYWRSGTAVVKPDNALTEKERKTYGNPVDGPFACALHVNYIPESPGGAYAELVFFARVDAIGLIRAYVKFGRGYIGSCNQLRPIAKETRDHRTKRLQTRTFEPQLDALALCDEFISWGSGDIGPIKTSAHHEFLFCAEHEEPSPGATCRHALGQLTNLAEILGV